MTDLSPAARAVWEAFRQFDEAGMHVDYDVKIAAALRAAADQVLAAEWEGQIRPDTTHMLGINWSRDALLAIAAELESADV